ncbi:MAG: hypothetical protein F4Y30_12190 [Chloroflexi bacterium]|nr:hypothetical protein [Chloroflexota bacterium]MYH65644.1 hypothetical protein [Chloroflexota bacterium]MYI41021.1 hypothetical protein [Chloroflexota bacterium]
MVLLSFASQHQRPVLNHPNGSYLNKRLLRLQVGFLLSAGPGACRTFPLDIPQRLQVDDDLFVESLAGELALTRAKDGVLLQGKLAISHLRECDRCLEPFEHRFELDIAELYALPSFVEKSIFRVDSNGEIDLAPLLREEALIEASYRAVCRDDCRGLSAETGDKLSVESDWAVANLAKAEAGAIDPRMAVLKQLLV